MNRNELSGLQRADVLVRELRNKNRAIEPTLSPPANYQLFLNDRSIQNPFAISSELVQIISRHTFGCLTNTSKARAVFTWMQEHVEYGKRSSLDPGYLTSLETLEKRKGVCGEQAFLYICMARSIGIASQYVSVTRDSYGKSVHHGCASIQIESGIHLVDPAYRTFGILHQEFRIMQDREIIEQFNGWRK